MGISYTKSAHIAFNCLGIRHCMKIMQPVDVVHPL